MRCRRCAKDKPVEDFALQPGTRRGRHLDCKDCRRVVYRERAGFAHPICYLSKRCRACGIDKPRGKFDQRSDTFDGRDSRCSACKSAARRQREREAVSA